MLFLLSLFVLSGCVATNQPKPESAKATTHTAMRVLRSFVGAFRVTMGDVSLSVDPTPGTADSGILDRCHRWFNLPRAAIERAIPDAWIVDLGGAPHCSLYTGTDYMKPMIDLFQQCADAGLKTYAPYTVNPRCYDLYNVNNNKTDMQLIYEGYRLQRDLDWVHAQLGAPDLNLRSCACYVDEVGNKPQGLILGEIQRIWLDDEVVKAAEDSLQIDAAKLDPLSRLGGIQYADLGQISEFAKPK